MSSDLSPRSENTGNGKDKGKGNGKGKSKGSRNKIIARLWTRRRRTQEQQEQQEHGILPYHQHGMLDASLACTPGLAHAHSVNTHANATRDFPVGGGHFLGTPVGIVLGRFLDFKIVISYKHFQFSLSFLFCYFPSFLVCLFPTHMPEQRRSVR